MAATSGAAWSGCGNAAKVAIDVSGVSWLGKILARQPMAAADQGGHHRDGQMFRSIIQHMSIPIQSTGIVGTGAMGRGIAQMAAQAGSQVILFDNQPQASEKAYAEICAQWDRLSEKGRMDAAEVTACKQRLGCASALDDLAPCNLVIEAIVERLDAKKGLFASLEGILPATAILATNTSSLSVTAIAAGLQRPQRVAGLHFFNPVPLMKVVEVIAGLQTDPQNRTSTLARSDTLTTARRR